MATIRGKNKDDRLDGTTGDDDLFGYKGDDKISGGDGDDWIVGHEGNDKLTGGPGADYFVFAFKKDMKQQNVDKIMDYNPEEGDRILLDYTVFKHIGFGEVDNKYIAIGKRAKDADDYLIYNPKSGEFFYDEDAKGGAKQHLVLIIPDPGHLANPFPFF